MAVSKRLRFEILRRDNHTCRYCGATSPDVKLTVDHVTPVALGGSDDPINLVTACADCNSGKSSVPADAERVDDVAQDALRWARAVERAAVIQGEREEIQRSLFEVAAQPWVDFDGWSTFNPKTSWYGRPTDWADTIRTFLARGLSPETLVENAHSALDKSYVSDKGKWKYFCGICWKQLTERQEIAQALLTQEEADD